MRKSSPKVHQIYSELRRAVGDEIPAGELLRLALKLVKTANPLGKSEASSIKVFWPDFDEMALDEAFMDGGWKVMSQERHDKYGDDYNDSFDWRSTTRHFSVFGVLA